MKGEHQEPYPTAAKVRAMVLPLTAQALNLADLPFLALSQAIPRALEETNGGFCFFLVGKNKNRNHWHQHPVFCKMPEAHCTNKLSIFIFLLLFLDHLGSARRLFQRLDSPELELRFITICWLATHVEDNRPAGKAPPLLR